LPYRDSARLHCGWTANAVDGSNQARGEQIKTLFLLAENILGERTAWGQSPLGFQISAQTFFSFGVKHQSAAWFKCIVNSIALFAAHISTFFHDQMGPITGAQISVRYSAQRFGKLHSRIITFNNIQMF
jgi:hypothetical protein